jgi:hypothetical protein
MIGLVIGLIFLVACQSGSDLLPGKEYPEPLQENLPTETPRPTVLPGQAMYPEIESNSNINWFQAEAMILNGEVDRLVLQAGLNFQMMLKDGRLFNSTQPSPEAITQTLENCGELCSATQVVQE